MKLPIVLVFCSPFIVSVLFSSCDSSSSPSKGSFVSAPAAGTNTVTNTMTTTATNTATVTATNTP